MIGPGTGVRVYLAYGVTDRRKGIEGLRIETGRRFLPEALGLVTGGLFGFVGPAARSPIRITADILDDGGQFLGKQAEDRMRRASAPGSRNQKMWSRSCPAVRSAIR